MISPKRTISKSQPAGRSHVKRSSADESLIVVREALGAYADRGVFRGFSETQSRQGLPAFRFVWLLDRKMELVVDVAKGELRFKDVLPGLPARSPLYAELREFLRERQHGELPAHRSIDPARCQASIVNRRGLVSIVLAVKDNQYAYGANRIVNLVHELFVHLRDAWPEYLVEQFDVAEE